jgi:hypothetical protein
MRAVAIAATYPPDQLSAAELVVERLADLTSIAWDGQHGVIEVKG